MPEKYDGKKVEKSIIKFTDCANDLLNSEGSTLHSRLRDLSTTAKMTR
jgi:hypothetical protein